MYKRIIFLFLFAFLFTNGGFAQISVTVEQLIQNPSRYENEFVVCEGFATQWFSKPTSTSFYILKGFYGQILRVNTTSSAPELYKKYKVSGTLYIDRKDGTPVAFMSEKTRDLLSSGSDGGVTGGTGTGTTGSTGTQEVIPPPPPQSDNTMLIIIIVIALGVLIALFFYFQNKSKAPVERQESFPIRNDSFSSPAPVAPSPMPVAPAYSGENDFKTIRIVAGDPKTLKFIPGQLVITSGADKGKSFRIAGYPTPDGSVVSIGREEISGERAYAHIQLKEKTISRKQAEIISRDGKLFLKNLSETNYTQLNGIELRPGERSELIPDSLIRTGEVEFQYKI